MGFALYRKYRPQRFQDLHGQDTVQSILLAALKQNKIVHAYLFSGPRGTGKTSTARLLAKAILCEKRLESGEACDQCSICLSYAQSELLDLIEIDAASNRGIDEIRDLREKIHFAPTRAKAKVYIIDEVHMLTKEAFNALLKSLEEPPAHVFFILATTEIHKIPETILSRCQRYDFKRISTDALMARLEWIGEQEAFTVEPEALRLIARHAEGGMRDAIALLEQFATEPVTADLVRDRLGLSHYERVEGLFGALGSADSSKALALIESLYQDGADLSHFTSQFLSFLREKLHLALKEKKETVLPKLLEWIELFDDAWVKLKRASIATLPLEIAVIRATQSPGTVSAQIVSEPSRRAEGLMHLDAIKNQLPAVYNLIVSPSVRSSFQTAQVKSLTGKRLSFAFNTRFHLQKVQMPAALVEVEQALKKILGSDWSFSFELEEAKIPPAVTPQLDAASLGWDIVEEPLS